MPAGRLGNRRGPDQRTHHRLIRLAAALRKRFRNLMTCKVRRSEGPRKGLFSLAAARTAVPRDQGPHAAQLVLLKASTRRTPIERSGLASPRSRLISPARYAKRYSHLANLPNCLFFSKKAAVIFQVRYVYFQVAAQTRKIRSRCRPLRYPVSPKILTTAPLRATITARRIANAAHRRSDVKAVGSALSASADAIARTDQTAAVFQE
jgi:hypothetical protein